MNDSIIADCIAWSDRFDDESTSCDLYYNQPVMILLYNIARGVIA